MEINKNLALYDGSYAFQFWQKPPVPVEFSRYVFDIINPDEVAAGKAYPRLVEMGPYVYEMSLNKTSIQWNSNNTVSYVQIQSLRFNRDKSVGPDTDTFLTLNIPFFTTGYQLRFEFDWFQRMSDRMFRMKNETAFKKLSVHDIWWGYDDPVLKEAKEIFDFFNISSSVVTGKFGFYMDRNNTGDGLWTVDLGKADDAYKNYIMVDKWNGVNTLEPLWNSDICNRIGGTDGSQHPPFVTPSSTIEMFDPNLYRTLKLAYDGPSTYNGVRGLRFKLPYSAFASGLEVPENLGLCTPDPAHCIPSGAYNLTNTKGAPVYVSMPHFLGADPYYTNMVQGLKPDAEKHQPFYDIHELTGVSLQGARRYQLVVRTE